MYRWLRLLAVLAVLTLGSSHSPLTAAPPLTGLLFWTPQAPSRGACMMRVCTDTYTHTQIKPLESIFSKDFIKIKYFLGNFSLIGFLR